ncbi:MAG: hydantoinase/oxoprolinase family protein [Gammaproteobacteria bacterium]|jgi:N-methylhydantoinase A|nr:hydantoinase/oxoprolinase family protein [Gammaproteobacteria bacterium]
MNQTQQFQIGIDIGGTFTDFSLFDRDNKRLFVHKQLTTPENPLQSVRDGVVTLIAKADVQLSQVSRINHATTLIANAILERKGDTTGLLCTKGFISIFDIGKEQRYDLYDFRIEFPRPLVPLPLRREIKERINSRGKIELEISEAEVIANVQELVDKHKISSLAICFINSYRNSVHEEKVREIVSREFPQISITSSADVFSSVREYERWTTTIVNAYTQSIFKTYLSELDGWLQDNGFPGELFLIVSDGGMINTDIARQYPVRMLASGSAATVLMCNEISKTCDCPELLMFDMGGTTTKLGVIKNGIARKRYDIEVGRVYQNKKGSGLPVFTPVFDLVEIASGGCSIASIDQRGMLQVGPESMGAYPGPACFGFGGDQATTADANLLLGFYGKDNFLGGELDINLAMAEKVITKNLTAQLDTSAARTAWGIYESVNEKTLAAIRNYSAERGIDYRKCQMVITGGAAAAHAMAIARKLGLEKVIIPLASGVASAVGLLTAPISFESLQSYRVALTDLTKEDFKLQFKELENRILQIISQNKVSVNEPKVARRLDMRYTGQGFEIEINLPVDEDLDETYESLTQLFSQAYEKQFFTCFPEQEIEIISWKAEVTTVDSNSIGNYTFDEHKDGGNASVGNRKVFSFKEDIYVDWPVFNRYALQAGEKLTGPLLIEDHETTSVFFEGDVVEIDNNLNLIAKPA